MSLLLQWPQTMGEARLPHPHTYKAKEERREGEREVEERREREERREKREERREKREERSKKEINQIHALNLMRCYWFWQQMETSGTIQPWQTCISDQFELTTHCTYSCLVHLFGNAKPRK